MIDIRILLLREYKVKLYLINIDMKKLIFIIIVAIAAFIAIGCSNSPVEEVVYVPVKDTVSDIDNIQRIIYLEHKLKLTQDSLHQIRDSIGDELFIARYKLARIKEYTNIVDRKPNQIKFYKGWIKRVLEN